MDVSPLDPAEVVASATPSSSDAKTLMRLGGYRFALETAAYQSLERSNSWRWPEVERIGARPALQYVGPGLETISMRGVIYPHFKGGLGQLDFMRGEADKGTPLRLVSGSGRVFGLYVINEIRETQRVFFSNGAPRAQEFDLTVTFYGDAAAEQPQALAGDA